MRPASALLAAIAVSTVALPAQTIDIPDRRGVPDWKAPAGFERDVFTFVRLRPQFHSKWHVDYPDSDLNFSYRLHEMTALKVNPNPRLIAITSPELRDFPFVYIVEPGGLHLTSEEASLLRAYLLNGGFLMLDDFWRESDWQHVLRQMRELFPDRAPVELGLDHPIFHTVFDIKEKPQIPAMELAIQGRPNGVTWESGANHFASFYGIFDDKGRMMVVICRDTDLGDGWEREGDDEWFFREFSEKKAYPMGINIVVYAMTH